MHFRLVWDKTDFYSIHYFLFLPWGYTRFLTTTCSGLNWNFFCTCTFRNDYPNSSTSFFFFFWIICLFVFYFCIQVSSKKLLHCWYFDTQVKCGLKPNVSNITSIFCFFSLTMASKLALSWWLAMNDLLAVSKPLLPRLELRDTGDNCLVLF